MKIKLLKKKLKTLSAKYNPAYFYNLIDKKVPLDKYVQIVKKYILIAEKYINISIEKKLYAAYFPFIGWLIPFHFNKDDNFAMHHGKQSFLISAAFAALLIFIYFTTYFIPVKLKVVKLSLVIIFYLLELLYLGIFIAGTRWIVREEKKSFPLVNKYDHLLNI